MLHYPPEELKAGKINIFDHLSEILPKEGAAIGIFTMQNGIMTSSKEFHRMCTETASKLPEQPFLMGIYNPSKGFIIDVGRTLLEKVGFDTAIVRQTRQIISAISEILPNINPEMLWAHICHSEGGIIGKRAFKGLDHDERSRLRKHLITIGIAPAAPISRKYTLDAVNVYSEKDHVTKGFASSYVNDPNYDIRFVPCITPPNERGFFSGDHAFSGDTYQSEIMMQMNEMRKNYGVYDAKTR